MARSDWGIGMVGLGDIAAHHLRNYHERGLKVVGGAEPNAQRRQARQREFDLPLAVANAPSEMRRAIDELGEVDLVLIDTAGRSPRDEVKIRELADFLAAAQPDEVHLVLSAVAGERSLRAAVERFAVAHADRLILTKLDEADGLGGVLGVLGHADRPVSYLTTGQAVPDDIEPADRARLARLILGHEAVS